MADFSHYSTKKALHEEVFNRLRTKAMNLSREELIRLLNVLTWDFGLCGDGASLENSRLMDNQASLEQILKLENGVILSKPSDIDSSKWSADVKLLPLINFAEIFSYLILSPSALYNTRTLCDYASLEAYKLVESNDVGDLKSYSDPTTMDEWIFVKATVCASQTNGRLYSPWVLLHSTNGKVKGGQCSCVAGLGESCSHIGAILFILEKITSAGINRRAAATEVQCQWRIPSFEPTTTVTPVSNFEVVQRIKRQTSSVCLTSTMVDDMDLLEFLELNVPGCRLCADIAPAYGPAFIQTEDDVMSVVSHIDDVAGELGIPTILPMIADYVKSNPPGCVNISNLFKLITGSVDDQISELIEKETREQSASTLWKEIRKGRITASATAHRIRSYYRTAIERRRVPEALVNSIIQKETSEYSNDAMEWGRKNEAIAKETFANWMKKEHPRVIVEDVGLKFIPGCGHFGASADGLIRCDCESCTDLAVLEIKAPFSIQDEDPSSPAVARKLPFVKLEGNRIILNNRHPYFTQVQTQMACWHATRAYFFVWTLKGFLVIDVEFDREFWLNLKDDFDNFYLNHVVPGLVKIVLKEQ